MANLFTVLAGESDDSFKLGNVDFKAAPFTLMEFAEYRALPDDMGSQAEYMADKLRRRVKGNKHDPATIDRDWVLENLTLPMKPVLEHVMLYGKMPEAGGSGKV